MPRKRIHDIDLPRGLFRHGRKLRRKDPDNPGKWQYFDNLVQYAEFVEQEHSSEYGTIGRGIIRYRDEVLPLELAKETQRTEKPRLNRLLRVFGHMEPEHLRQVHIYQYMDKRGSTAANREIARLSAVFRYMIRWGMAEHNPCVGIMRESEPARDRYVDDWEMDIVLAVALDRAFAGQRSAVFVWAVMQLEYLTGRRESTILALRRSDITDDGLLFRESKVSRRNQRGDVVKKPLEVIAEWTPELERVVETIKHVCRVNVGSLYLIPNRDGSRCSPGSFNRAWQALRPWVEMAGVAPLQPRDIRAKHLTDFDEADLGHSDARVTRIHYQRKPKIIKSLK